MPSKQTRRSISVRGATYESLRTYCDTHKKSMSEVVEELLAPLLSARAPTRATVSPRPRVLAAPPPRPRAPVANKVVRAAAPPAPAPAPRSGARPAGRPAPTPAAKVVAERPKAPKGDYREIQF
jgi:hypothetical protein